MDETTPFCQNSLYSVAKLVSHMFVNNYRDACWICACKGPYLITSRNSVPQNS